MNLEINIKVPLSSEVSISQSTSGDAAEVAAGMDPVSAAEPPSPIVDGGPIAEPGGEAAPPPLVDLEAAEWSAAEMGPQPPSVESLEMWTVGGPPGLDEMLPSPEDLGLDASLDTVDLEPPAVEELVAIIEGARNAEEAPAKSTRTPKTTQSAAKKPRTKQESSPK